MKQSNQFFYFVTDRSKFDFLKLNIVKIISVIMPRASDIVQLSTSEENALCTRGYEISAKLGEGAYAKVCVTFINFELGFETVSNRRRYT